MRGMSVEDSPDPQSPMVGHGDVFDTKNCKELCHT